MEEVICCVGLIGHFFLFDIKDLVLLLVSVNDALQFLHIVGVGSNVSQCLHDALFRMLPFTFICPTDSADIAVMTTLRIIYIFAFYNTASENLLSAFLYKDDVSGFQLIGKLPCCKYLIFVRAIVSVQLLHLAAHFFFGAISHQITEIVPSDCHNAIGIVFLPVDRAITGSIEPIADSRIINGQCSVSSLFRNDAFKDFLAKGNINSVFICNLLTAPTDAVRFITGLFIVVFHIIVGSLKGVDHPVFSVVLSHIHDKVDCCLSV